MSYRIEQFSKEVKHLKGAKNPQEKIIAICPTLLDAEKKFYMLCKKAQAGNFNHGFRIRDLKFGKQREFWNFTNAHIYVKTLEKHPKGHPAAGKNIYQSYSLQEYRDFIRRKSANPFAGQI